MNPAVAAVVLIAVVATLAAAQAATAAVEVRQMTDDTIAPANTLNCSSNFATSDEGVDVDPPNLGVKIPGGQTLAGALDNGVKAPLSSGEPCGLDVSLLISKKLANHLGIPRLVGSAHSALAKAGSKTVATDFTRKPSGRLRAAPTWQ